MPNWLTKASGALSRQTEEVPQTFQLTCECSEKHNGQRKTRPQRIICQTCGAALFVLPKNVYPPPKARPARKAGRKRRRADGPPTGPGLPSTQDMAAAVRRGMIGVAGGLGSGLGAAGRAVRQQTTSAVAASARSVRGFFSPFRLVLAGMALMLLATGYLAIQAHSRELARESFREGLEAGQAALAQDDLLAARNHFAAAATAVETLDTHDAQSNLVRQLHRETTAMTNLAPGSLFEMLEEGESAQKKNGDITWEDFFRSRYEGSWFVLQAPVRRDGSSFVLDFRYTIGADRRRVTVRADVSDFDRVSTEGDAANVLFAAPVIGCELTDAQDEWIVTLDGEEGFLWSHLDNLRPLGFFNSEWVDEEEIAALLDAQTELLGRMP